MTSSALQLDPHDPARSLLTAARAGRLIDLPTSASTGPARRVLRTAASWIDSFPVVAELWGLDRSSRAWVPGPLTATMNLYAVCLAAWAGATLTAVQPSHAFLTPTALQSWLELTTGGRASSPAPARGLTAVVAGDRLSPALADRADTAGLTVQHYYGAAQLSFVACGRDADRLLPFPQVEVETRAGELWVRSPWVCVRETGGSPGQSGFRQLDGWSTVGDRGIIHPDGRVEILGRPGAILVGGSTVLIADVEPVLARAARGEVRVVAAPHPRYGSVVAAVCTDPRDLATLPAVARGALSAAEQPRRWLFRESLPLTAAGKVDRPALQRWVDEAGRGKN